MERNNPFAAKIAFRLPTSLYFKLNAWAEAEDRPLANLVYSLVKKAVTEREQAFEAADLQENANGRNVK